ncbi:MAG: hypothetical protein GY818_13380 [Planctomycetaceae bacterium]|nr:hypothetical protein [Planctomycetaceae bacterium]
MTTPTPCPVKTACESKSTEMLKQCLSIFEKKGTMNLTQDEFFVEGTMLEVLCDRGYAKWADAYVERS